jgi:hypothetical protein
MNCCISTSCSAAACAGVAAVSSRLRGDRTGQRLGTADGRLHYQVLALHVVVAHVRPALAQAVDALCQQAVNAVPDAGAAALVAQCQSGGAGQTQAPVDLLEQQHATIANDVATVECSLHHALSNPSKLELANFCPDTLAKLKDTARRKLKSGQKRKSIISACWKQAELW